MNKDTPRNYELPSAAIERFHRRLLPPTIAHALKTPFYRKHLGQSTQDTTGDITKLPLVSKAQLSEAGDDAIVHLCENAHVTHTSGTTGTPFMVVRSSQELEYCRSFFRSLFPEHESVSEFTCVELSDPFTAFDKQLTSPLFIHRVSPIVRGSFEHVRALLGGAFTFSRPAKLLLGQERIISAFACDTRKHRGEFHSHLEQIHTYGNVLTKKARMFLTNTFGCDVIDHYGMTEIFGTASEDPETGWYYFEPCIIAEAVDLTSNELIREGTGILVLTALYPFQQSQPLIRYYTDDVVEVTHSDSAKPGRFAFKPKGRSPKGVPASDSGEWLILPSELYSIMQNDEGVAQKHLLSDWTSGQPIEGSGHPQYEVSWRDEHCARLIELKVQMKRGASVEILAARIREQLAHSNPHLGPSLAAGLVRLDVIVNQ